MAEKKSSEEQKKTETTEASSTTKQTKKSASKSKKSEKDYEKQIIELAKKGYGPEKIGLELKKQDIHPKEQDKKISDILKENNLYENPDIKNIENKLERIKEHYSNNKQDKKAMRERDRIFSKLRKLKKHFGIEIKKKSK